MKPHHLSSKNNPILKEYRKLLTNRNYRRKNEKIAVEGPNLVKEALQAGLIPEVVLMAENYGCGKEKKWLTDLPLSTQQIFLSSTLFKELAETETPQEVAAIFPFVFRDEKTETKKTPELVVIADRLQDPGNMGALIRTAAAAGADLLFCTEGCTDPYSPKVLRSTAGSIFRIGVREVSDTKQLIAELKEKGFLIVATAGGADQPYWSGAYDRDPVALIIGNEAVGVASELRSMADLVASIPLYHSVESLNAAVAAGIILFEIRRQKSTVKT
ncbi:MAG: RNA methyltransferase [Firmicutes bacterium]|nr:RNA methyltransferase [Bacillota bacterium]